MTVNNPATRGDLVKTENGSAIVFMAHSLGNMLASFAISDFDMSVDKYFALNSAVASEAYDVNTVDERDAIDNYMQHENWAGYSDRTWASNWHKLFPAGDDRAKLTWRNRFTNVLERTQMYNFWSSGDEVLEIAIGGAPYVSDLVLGTLDIFNLLDIDTRQYVWHKQELYKGRNLIYGTGWAGWGFKKSISVTNANIITEATLRDLPIFERDPSFMFTNVISTVDIDRILIKGIPALSAPLGQSEIRLTYGDVRNIDMNKDTDEPDGVERLNGWPFGGTAYQSRWLHSQLIYVAHYYTHKLYSKFIELGDLR